MSALAPSIVLAVRPRGAKAAGVSDVEKLLSAAGIACEKVTPCPPTVAHGARWEAEIEPGGAHVWLEPAPRETIEEMTRDAGLEWRGVLDEDVQSATEATWAMGVGVELGDEPLGEYHQQLKLLAALAPDAVFALDVSALTPRPGEWLAEVAASQAPPSPETLFTIHCVGDQGESTVWMHTHGLDRCGSVELDLVDVPASFVSLAGTLLNTVATMFIEQGVPEADEVFVAGHGIELLWLPWEDAMDKVGRNVPGGRGDRRDEAHCGARGVLFAPAKGLFGRRKHKGVDYYREQLEQNPLLYISDMQTERAAALARERLPRFRALYERFSEDKTDEGEKAWLFLVKLGYTIDGAESETDREHLWFEIHAMSDERVEATLLNEPYSIASMREGQRGEHSLSKLSDWTVLCEHGRFEPDTIRELERLLEKESNP
ncbi:MAG: DUF4026 domain-containing protein [Myxococcales bacterium]|nr:DUF4026 domain-containing protein [Myxococcales bacterium]